MEHKLQRPIEKKKKRKKERKRKEKRLYATKVLNR
jgi:hypothetical protein